MCIVYDSFTSKNISYISAQGKSCGLIEYIRCALEAKTDPTKGKYYCIYTLKTKAPLRLNIEDGL